MSGPPRLLQLQTVRIDGSPARLSDRLASTLDVGSLLGLGQRHEPTRPVARLDVDGDLVRRSAASSWNSLTLGDRLDLRSGSPW